MAARAARPLRVARRPPQPAGDVIPSGLDLACAAAPAVFGEIRVHFRLLLFMIRQETLRIVQFHLAAATAPALVKLSQRTFIAPPHP